MNEIFNEDGTFAEGSSEKLQAIIAEDEKLKDTDLTKMFKQTPDFPTLLRNHVHTKRTFNTKLENVIQRPGKDADEEQIKQFHSTLLTEAGAPKSPKDYNFKIPALPEGLQYNKDVETFWRETFAKLQVPKPIAEALFKINWEQVIQQHENAQGAAQKHFDTSVEELKNDWKGDDLVKNVRIAHDALMEFGSDDVEIDGQNVKGLKTLLKESKVYDTPDDFEKWQKLGINIADLRVWSNIGRRMQPGSLPSGETKQEKPDADQAFIDKVNAGSPSLARK